MSKAQRIRALYAQGKSTREIADEIGCADSYVRVCARQRVPGGNDPEENRRRRLLALADKYGDREAARRAGTAAYRAKLAAGFSSQQACNAHGGAYTKALLSSIVRNIPKVPA